MGFATFDELVVPDLFTPSITTVVQPAFDIGFKAAEILLQRIRQDPPVEQWNHIRLPATLNIRDSSRQKSLDNRQSLTA
jgi:LacI family transcriptional regulator